MKLLSIKLIKYTVKNEDAKIFDKLVPINETVRNFALLSMIYLVKAANLYFCLIQTSICSLLAEINAISVPENKIEKKIPISAKFISSILYNIYLS